MLAHFLVSPQHTSLVSLLLLPCTMPITLLWSLSEPFFSTLHEPSFELFCFLHPLSRSPHADTSAQSLCKYSHKHESASTTSTHCGLCDFFFHFHSTLAGLVILGHSSCRVQCAAVASSECPLREFYEVSVYISLLSSHSSFTETNRKKRSTTLGCAHDRELERNEKYLQV